MVFKLQHGIYKQWADPSTIPPELARDELNRQLKTLHADKVNDSSPTITNDISYSNWVTNSQATRDDYRLYQKTMSQALIKLRQSVAANLDTIKPQTATAQAAPAQPPMTAAAPTAQSAASHQLALPQTLSDNTTWRLSMNIYPNDVEYRSF